MDNFTVLHVPHASVNIPERYLNSFRKEVISRETDVMTDWFCDKLFDCGRDMIVFPVSRLVCDVERFRNDKDEIMSEIGMGVTYTRASDGNILRIINEKEKNAIISQYYDVHHKSFTTAVTKKIEKFGKCLIIDCHSFYPSPLPYELCQNEDRPDFCIGISEYHTPKAISETLSNYIMSHGYTIKINSPFSGTIVPMRYYEKDRRVFSVMIEVNRKLYTDAPGVKNNQFEKIQRTIKGCVESVENCVNSL